MYEVKVLIGQKRSFAQLKQKKKFARMEQTLNKHEDIKRERV